MTSSNQTGAGNGTDGEDGDPKWYVGWVGVVIISAYVLLTLVAMVVSARELSFTAWLVEGFRLVSLTPPRWLVSQSGLPTVQTTIPIDVYLFGLAGALTRFLLSFVTDITSLTAPGKYGSSGDDTEAEKAEATKHNIWSGSEVALAQIVLGIPAAVYIAAGVYLAGNQISGVLQLFDAEVVYVTLSFVAGFYVKRSYALLGDIADRLLKPVEKEEEKKKQAGESMLSRSLKLSAAVVGPAAETEEEAEEGGKSVSRPWYRGVVGMGLFVGAILVAVVVLLAVLQDGPGEGICAGFPCFRISADIYLYSFMGGVGYVFTRLFVDVKRTRQSVIESSVRILAGMFLAIGIYILFNPTTEAVSAIAFLVGLYLNVAVVRLDALAEQVFARLREVIAKREESEEGEESGRTT